MPGVQRSVPLRVKPRGGVLAGLAQPIALPAHEPTAAAAVLGTAPVMDAAQPVRRAALLPARPKANTPPDLLERGIGPLAGRAGSAVAAELGLINVTKDYLGEILKSVTSTQRLSNELWTAGPPNPLKRNLWAVPSSAPRSKQSETGI